MYLHPSGVLRWVEPSEAGTASYVYDAAVPMATQGGCNMGSPFIIQGLSNLACGPWDQLPIYKERNDLLTFTSDPLGKDLGITGRIRVVLHVSSNASDTDFTAKLLDVFPNGTRLLLQVSAPPSIVGHATHHHYHPCSTAIASTLGDPAPPYHSERC